MSFRDYFTKQSGNYAVYRPAYPDELFNFLSRVAPSNETAWDCATGNGQAANGLAKYFNKVIASDASAEQVGNSFENNKITYRVFPAEKADIESSSIDLVTVAQALHWFDVNKFYSEVRRVAKKGGILAVWMYDLVKIAPEINQILSKFDNDILKNHWPPERQLFYEKYASIPFPFEQINTPEFKMSAGWSFEDLTGFLGTWSAVQKFKDSVKSDPVELIRNDLQKAWGKEKILKAEWDIILKAGKV